MDKKAELAVLPAGKTLIHKSTQAEEIHQFIMGICLLPEYKKDWKLLCAAVKEEFGLEVSPAVMSNFVKRYVYPQMVVPDGYYKAAVLDATEDIAAVKSVFTALEDAKNMLREGMSRVGEYEVGERGGITRTGPTHYEGVKMAKEVQAMATKAMDELARIGLGPEGKGKGGGMPIDLNINLKNSSGALSRFPNEPTVDATFHSKDDEEP